MVVAGAVSTLGFVCFFPAWRRGRLEPVDDVAVEDVQDAATT
jgi:hypothetical protein